METETWEEMRERLQEMAEGRGGYHDFDAEDHAALFEALRRADALTAAEDARARLQRVVDAACELADHPFAQGREWCSADLGLFNAVGAMRRGAPAAEAARENVSAGTTDRTAPEPGAPEHNLGVMSQGTDPDHVWAACSCGWRGPSRWRPAGTPEGDGLDHLAKVVGTAPEPDAPEPASHLRGCLDDWDRTHAPDDPGNWQTRALLSALVREVADLRALVDRAAREDVPTICPSQHVTHGVRVRCFKPVGHEGPHEALHAEGKYYSQWAQEGEAL